MTLRLFIDEALAQAATEPESELAPGPARHVQVRRLQPGDPLVLFDGRGGEWTAEVGAIGRQRVTVRRLQPVEVDREAPLAVTLAVGMPANERMDALVEKATELGAAAIVPLMGERSVLKLAGERAERRRQHWQAVAVAAAEQCGRTRVPAVAPVQNLASWLAGLEPAAPAQGMSGRWLLSPGAAQPALHGAVSPDRLTVLSGPEGGLTPAEQAAAVARGFVAVGLGPRVLRADTAPLAVLAWLTLQR